MKMKFKSWLGKQATILCESSLFIPALFVLTLFVIPACSRVKQALDQDEMREYKRFVEDSHVNVRAGDTAEADAGCNRPGGGKVIGYFDPETNEIVINEDYFKNKSIEEIKEVIVHEIQHRKNRDAGVTNDFEDEYLARKAECDMWRRVKKPGQTGISDTVCGQIYMPDGTLRPREDVKRLLEDLCYTFEGDRRERKRKEWREKEIVLVSLPNSGLAFKYPSTMFFRGQEVVDAATGAVENKLDWHDESKTGCGFTSLRVRVEPDKQAGGKYETLEDYIKATKENRRQTGSKLIVDKPATLAGESAYEAAYEFDEQRPAESTKQVTVTTIWRWCAALHSNRFYEVFISTSKDDYENDLKAFDFLKSSINFTEIQPGAELAHWSSVEPAVEFDYPASWSVTRWYPMSDYDGGLALRVVGPKESVSRVGETSFYVHVIPSGAFPGGKIDLESFTQSAILNRTFGKTEILTNGETKLSGESARNVAVKFTTDRPGWTITWMQVETVWEWISAVHDGKLYETYFIASAKDRTAHADRFNKFAASFTIK